ncbi:hypothetical protein ACHAXH_005129 [Discostella pseudostelligera]
MTSASASSKSMSPNNNTTSTNSDDGESRTTILPPGIVESRNYDKHTKSQQISAEIQAFLSGHIDDGGNKTSHSEFRTFFTIWMFITRLPSPSWIDLHPGYLMRGMSYFPVAGSILGSMYAIVFECLHVSLGLPASVAASVTIAFGLYITGYFHEDGLADSADGMGGGWSKSQVLRIMTDSRVGTFGCAALSLFLFTKVQLLGSLEMSRWNVDIWQGGSSAGAGPAILVAQTLSRLSAPYLIRTRDYVAEVGPKSPFYLFMVEAKHIVTWSRVLFAMCYCFVVSAVLYGQAFAAVLIVTVLSLAHLAGTKGEYLLGGVMGDFLGATICICEILVLILIASRDSIIETYRVITETIHLSDGSLGSSGFYQQMVALYCLDRVRPLFHFLSLMVALKMWCTFVGPPDMYDREEKKEAEANAEKND